ncbi:MAG: hypothetical protein IJD77_07750 [Clostridia bacterium]|nr:hypothetical protein [Clostridia bacterium]
MEEREFLQLLLELEDLGSKKTKIYSRLLTDAALASEMEARAKRHDERKLAIEKLLYGKTVKKANDGGMSATNEKGE